MLAHVLEAQAAYARKIGIRQEPPAIDDVAAIEEQREAIATVLATASDGGPLVPNGWPRATPPGASPGTCSTTPGRCRTALNR